MKHHEIVWRIQQLIFETSKSKIDPTKIKDLSDGINTPLKELSHADVIPAQKYDAFKKLRKEIIDFISQSIKDKKDLRTKLDSIKIETPKNKELINNFIGLYVKTDLQSKEVFVKLNTLLAEIKTVIESSDKKLSSILTSLKKIDLDNSETLKKILEELRFSLLSKGWNENDIKSEFGFLERKMTEHLDTFIQRVSKDQKEFIFLLPLNELVTEIKTPLVLSDSISLHEKYQNKEIDESKKIPKDLSKFLESTLFEFKIHAYGWEEARISFFKLRNRFLDLASLIIRDDLKLIMNLGGKIQYNYLTYDPESKTSIINKHPKDGELVKLEITKNNYDDFHKLNFLLSEGDSELQFKFHNALHFFRKANLSESRSDKFIFYMIALESALLVQEDWEERISPIMELVLIERVIKVMGIIKDYEDKYVDIIKRLYYARHQIIHYGNVELVNEENIKDLKKIVSDVLYQLLYGITDLKIKKLSEFLKFIEEESNKRREKKLTEAKEKKLEPNKDYLCEGVLFKNDEPFANIKFMLLYNDDGKYVLIYGKLIELKEINSKNTLTGADIYRIEGKIMSDNRAFVAKEVNIFFPILFPFFNLKQMTDRGMAPMFNIGKIEF